MSLFIALWIRCRVINQTSSMIMIAEPSTVSTEYDMEELLSLQCFGGRYAQPLSPVTTNNSAQHLAQLAHIRIFVSMCTVYYCWLANPTQQNLPTLLSVSSDAKKGLLQNNQRVDAKHSKRCSLRVLTNTTCQRMHKSKIHSESLPHGCSRLITRYTALSTAQCIHIAESL